MADFGREILNASTFSAWGHEFPSMATFRDYLDALNSYRTELHLCGIDFTSLPGPDKDGKYWETELYHQEDDINLKAFRDNAASLHTASTQAAAQLDLIRQTEDLQDYWQGSAARATLHHYLTDAARLDQDRAHLVARSHDVAQVATNLHATLTSKAHDAAHAVSNLVTNALGNNLDDFKTRLRTAIEAMKANNQGGSGPFGLGTNQHRYIHHGGTGDNWSATDVRNDIQNTVISGFGYTFNALDKSNYATEEHLRTNYQTLLHALDDQGGPPQTPTDTPPPPGVLTLAELTQVYPHLSQSEAERFLPYLNRAMANAGATTPQAKAAFLATFGVETSELRLWREGEYINSDGSHGYATSDAEFDQQYAGVNGNVHPHDGSLFKGRGPIQLTGRANYQQFNDWYNANHPTQIDFMTHPELLEDRVNHPEYGFAAAEWYWTSHNLTAVANEGGIVAVTDIVNRGDANLQTKIDYYNRALAVFGG